MDATRTPYGDGNSSYSSPTSHSSTADATRAPCGDGNLNARKNRKIGITDATRAPHGDGN